MTHDELLAEIDFAIDDSKYNYDLNCFDGSHDFMLAALRKVVELHKPTMGNTMTLCSACMDSRPMDAPVILYPCPTIQAIEKELS